MIKKIFFILILSLIGVSVFFSCRKLSCEGCMIDNKIPIANAGRDTIILLPQDSVTIDGGASYDPDGNINEYFWSKISGPSSYSIINPKSAKTEIKKLTEGVYLFTLKVTDDEGLSATDTIIVAVDTALRNNHPPIADAGPDQVILVTSDFLFDGIVAILDGSQSADSENNITSYRWSIISSASSTSISNADAKQTEVKFFQYGSYQFELKVTDSGGLTSKDTIKISVDPDTTNYPPVANAGLDQTIFLPANSVMLDGTLSWDPNNNIIAYQWTKMSGPPSFNIANQNSVQTQVTLLVEGVYQFELKVTDVIALSSKDTVQVTVRKCGTNHQMINASLTLVANLPKPRAEMAMASAANKIVFAGGTSADERYGSSRVDIYDMVSQTWSTAALSVPRYGITAITVGNKILFAGGESGEVGDPMYQFHSQVDIYDASTNSWSISFLSEPQRGIVAATVGTKVFFAGSTWSTGYTNKVEIYDLSTNSWATKTLSELKYGISAVTFNNKIYFAGGELSAANNQFSSRIDIYDHVSNSWSTSTLSEPRVIAGGGTAANDKIFWAGGYDGSGAICKVEIKDLISQATSFDYLSRAGIVKAVLKNNKIIYFGYDKEFDVYDINSKTWSIGVLPKPYNLFISVNNTIYVAGANDYSNEIWKLE